MQAYLRPMRWLVDLLVLATGWWLVLLSAATCVEMVGRKMFQFSFQGIDEVGGYTLAVASAIGFSYTLLTRGHTRVDFLVQRLPQGVRAAMNWLAMVSLAALSLYAVRRGWHVLAESIEFQSHSTSPLQTPMWLPHSLWFFGWSLFALNAVVLGGHATWLLLRDRARLNRDYGPETLEEQIQAETGKALT
jgi:TRAP-type C4-dicarboxylate transport system permease small subunit